LITSVLIISIYIPLIHFLHRPDLSAALFHASPRTSPSSTLPLTHNDVEAIPPWEKLSIPDLNLCEKGTGAVIAVGMGLAAAPLSSGSLKTAGRPSTASVNSISRLEVRVRKDKVDFKPYDFAFERHRNSTISEMTLVPSHDTDKISDQAISAAPDLKPILSPPIRKTSQSRSKSEYVISPPPPVHLHRLPTSISMTFPKSQSESNQDLSSFRGMLDFQPTILTSIDSTRTVSFSRPGTPEVGSDGRVESMASFMNKKTSSLLCWFPLTVSFGTL
jgi:hypothetical protein